MLVVMFVMSMFPTKGKPATLLDARGAPYWTAGGNLVLRVFFRVSKNRNCGYESRRWLEFYDSHGIAQKAELPGASKPATRAGDSSWKFQDIDIPDTFEPGESLEFHAQGRYLCEDRAWNGDPLVVVFTVPPRGMIPQLDLPYLRPPTPAP